jgi:pantothenate kinase
LGEKPHAQIKEHAMPQAVASRYLQSLESLLESGSRTVLGLVGAPGSGKSTLAAALKEHFGSRTVIVPMDGYHLANSELAHLGRAGRKGSEDTFDSAGYVALLRRIRQQQAGEIIYAPEYRREVEEGIAGAIAVHPETQLVITEGNYLLLDCGHWAAVRPLLDRAWYVDVDDNVRRERLVERHMRFGRSRQDAIDWANNTDEPNARLIATTRVRADEIFRWE